MDLFLIDVVEETMPRTTLMVVVMLLCALLGAHTVRANQIIAGRGTVQHIDAEGGFFGIVSYKPQNGAKFFDPLFMPFRFRFDGLHIWFLVLMLPGWGSVHCWGESVLILKMMRWI